jgi:hypothetical protein
VSVDGGARLHRDGCCASPRWYGAPGVGWHAGSVAHACCECSRSVSEVWSSEKRRLLERPLHPKDARVRAPGAQLGWLAPRVRCPARLRLPRSAATTPASGRGPGPRDRGRIQTLIASLAAEEGEPRRARGLAKPVLAAVAAARAGTDSDGACDGPNGRIPRGWRCAA